MRVLVTGGTGFVGCHTVAALLAHGHQVRLLVRDPGRIAPALGPLGITEVDAVVGDVTNPATVQQAMEGCQAVVHAACVYSLDRRSAAVMAHTNPSGTNIVLGAAHRQGLDPIVYVSSVGVFWPTTTTRLTAGSRLGTGVGPYTRSKVATELVARGYQQAGAPVVITYPAGVLGPHDPHLSDTVRAIRDVLRGGGRCCPRVACPWWTCARWPPCTRRCCTRARVRAATCWPARRWGWSTWRGCWVSSPAAACRRPPPQTGCCEVAAAWSTGCSGCSRCGCRSAPKEWRRPSAPPPTSRWTTPRPARSLPSSGATCARP
jgi:NAD(P)-dependent dehydrogenase (short-subunit alcohol dehydrogenase family)